jgi:ribonuclease BN (tRNA processing enzyme)
VQVTLYGTRGSFPGPGPHSVRHGGHTSSATIRNDAGELLFLDAGTGITVAAAQELGDAEPVNVLLTHLHMDHVQGLGFFRPLYVPGRQVNVWGPPSSTRTLRKRLGRYLSPPLFPVRFIELPAQVTCHDATFGSFQVGQFTVHARLIIHPGATLGFRIECDGKSVAFLPDHEPQLGVQDLPHGEWLSGYSLARDADLLIHDAQYNAAEYATRVGWGHCTPEIAVQYAERVRAKRLLLYSHEPTRSDDELDAVVEALGSTATMPVGAAAERVVYEV